MTDPNYTAMLLVIDRSGSMAGIRDDMVGGLTTMLAEQAAEPGLLTVDIVTFDTEIETQCSLADPKNVTISLEPRGATALFDAIGQSVTGFGRVLAALPEHARPETVQVVVVTDGDDFHGEYRRGVEHERLDGALRERRARQDQAHVRRRRAVQLHDAGPGGAHPTG